MFKRRFLILLFFTALSLNSCDFVRLIFGLPTSETIKEIENKARADSIFRAAYLADEEGLLLQNDHEIFDPGAQGEEVIKPELSSSVTSTATTQAQPRVNDDSKQFHIIVGSFRVQENAARMVRRLIDRGYQAQELLFRNGFICVSAGSYLREEDARLEMRRLLDSGITTEAYIYDLNERKHVQR